jgi:hypothetical protein
MRRPVNHRFAVYLEQEIAFDKVLSGFGSATDCEHDKFGLDPKSVTNTWDAADLPERENATDASGRMSSSINVGVASSASICWPWN